MFGFGKGVVGRGGDAWGRSDVHFAGLLIAVRVFASPTKTGWQDKPGSQDFVGLKR